MAMDQKAEERRIVAVGVAGPFGILVFGFRETIALLEA